MGNFLVRYDYWVVIYDRRAFIRLSSGVIEPKVVILWTALLAFYSVDPSSNPTKVYSFFCKILFQKNNNIRGWVILKVSK